jgi:hypothetical protein
MGKILGNHKRRGKFLIPPFVAEFGPMQEVSWVRELVPELLWIALLHKAYGDRRAVDIVTKITRALRSLFDDQTHRKFCFISEWAEVPEINLDSKFGKTEGASAFNDAALVLNPLIQFYPKCPLHRLFSSNGNETYVEPEFLVSFASMVGDLFSRDKRFSMMVQATSIWTAFDSGELLVSEASTLAQFPEIDAYPQTEVSLKLAASIRATLNLIGGRFFVEKENTYWSEYFWKRGIELTECSHD